jgi:YHS domain-containing protein
MLMYVVMVMAALIVAALFSALDLVPEPAHHPGDMFAGIHLDYKLVLNVIATALFVSLMWLTARRGAVDPVCGMTVDRARARERGLTAERDGHTHYFCSAGCLATFTGAGAPAAEAHASAPDHHGCH